MKKKSKTFLVRRATSLDYEEIVKIFRKVLKEFDLPYIEGESNSDILNIDSQYKNHGAFYVLIHKEKIVGMVGLLPIKKQEAQLTKFYVLREYRNLGVGKELLKRVIEYAKNEGVKKITLETHTSLKSAIFLFLKFGFRKIERENYYTACDSYYSLGLE